LRRLILRSDAKHRVSKDEAAPVPQSPMVRDARLCRAPHHEASGKRDRLL